MGLIEPTKSLASKGLFLARSLCNPNMGAVTVAVLNTKEKHVTLERESIFGTIGSVSEIVKENIQTNTHKYSDQELPPHLQPLIDNINQNLSEIQTQKLKDLII